MKKNQHIIIPNNKNSILLMLLGSILFVIIGVVMINSEPTRKYSLVNIKTWGIIGVVFFSLGGLYFIKKLFDNKPGIILDKNGIWNNSSIISNHMIKWDELSRVSLKNIDKEKIIFLYFKDNKSFIKKFNLIEQFILKINLSLYNTPIGISARSLKYDIEKLNKEIKQRIKNLT
jgi:hypothetical protein